MKIFLLFLFLLTTAYQLEAAQPLAKLVSTESDPEAFIENHINVINGDYCESATDLVISEPVQNLFDV